MQDLVEYRAGALCGDADGGQNHEDGWRCKVTCDCLGRNLLVLSTVHRTPYSGSNGLVAYAEVRGEGAEALAQREGANRAFIRM